MLFFVQDSGLDSQECSFEETKPMVIYSTYKLVSHNFLDLGLAKPLSQLNLGFNYRYANNLMKQRNSVCWRQQKHYSKESKKFTYDSRIFSVLDKISNIQDKNIKTTGKCRTRYIQIIEAYRFEFKISFSTGKFPAYEIYFDSLKVQYLQEKKHIYMSYQ